MTNRARLSRLLFVAFTFHAVSTTSADAVTRRVPTDYPTIQAGIDAASDGDEVLVSSGVYQGAGNRDIRLRGKAITVRSEAGPAVTLIDPQGTGLSHHLAFAIEQGEGPGTVIEGFTIQHGFAPHGGGVHCWRSSPTIRHCTFYQNVGSGSDYPGNGAGLYCFDGSPRVEDCAFIENSGPSYGVVFAEAGASLTLVRCIFDGNEFMDGIVVADDASIYLEQCTLVASYFDYRPVLWGLGSGSIVVSRSIVAFNSGEAAACYGPGSSIELSCCDVFGNDGDWVDCISDQAEVQGNFSADPRLCGLPLHDVGLEPDSPCLPGHHPRGDDCGLIGAMPLGCGSSATAPATWGAIKTRFEATVPR